MGGFSPLVVAALVLLGSSFLLNTLFLVPTSLTRVAEHDPPPHPDASVLQILGRETGTEPAAVSGQLWVGAHPQRVRVYDPGPPACGARAPPPKWPQ